MKNITPTPRSLSFLSLIFCLVFFSVSLHAQKIQCQVAVPPDDNLIKALSETIKRNPSDAMARVIRARAYLLLLRYDDVLADVKAALAADPGIAEAYYLWGSVYETRANYPKAIAAFDKAIELDSFNKEYFFDRALSYSFLERSDLAVKDYAAAISIDGEFMSAYYNLGVSQISLKMSVEARSNFSATLKLAEKNIALYEKGPCLSDSYLVKGLIEHVFKDEKQAEIDLKTGKELEISRDTESRYLLGEFYLDIKYYQFALDELNEAIKIDPSFARAYKKRAEVYDRMFQKDKAAADRAKYDELSSRKELPMPQAPVPK